MTDFHVLIPSYNCSLWIERCLKSVVDQSKRPVKVLVIDDASTDRSYEPLARGLCDQYGYDYWRNDVNMKCPYNLRLGINLLDPKDDDVIFILDGDDFLPPKRVLKRFDQIYRDESVWLTYGNYKPYPHDTGQTLAHSYPRNVIRDRDFRNSPNCFNHPLTFRKFLWNEIRDEDLQTTRGKWFTGGYDKVIMVPMLEMCGSEHYKFINETLYMYNAVNPISDSQVNVNLIHESEQIVNRPKRELLIRG